MRSARPSAKAAWVRCGARATDDRKHLGSIGGVWRQQNLPSQTTPRHTDPRRGTRLAYVGLADTTLASPMVGAVPGRRRCRRCASSRGGRSNWIPTCPNATACWASWPRCMTWTGSKPRDASSGPWRTNRCTGTCGCGTSSSSSCHSGRLALEDAFETAAPETTAVATSASSGRLAWMTAAGALFVAVVALAVPALRDLRETPPPPETCTEISTLTTD